MQHVYHPRPLAGLFLHVPPCQLDQTHLMGKNIIFWSFFMIKTERYFIKGSLSHLSIWSDFVKWYVKGVQKKNRVLFSICCNHRMHRILKAPNPMCKWPLTPIGWPLYEPPLAVQCWRGRCAKILNSWK